MANVIMTIEPYWYGDTWVFDDESVGLEKEPFVKGIPEMIDALVKDIPDARSGFKLTFSSLPFPDYQVELIRMREEYGGCWYRVRDYSAEGWLCSALLRYFETPPETIYAKAEPNHRKFDIEPTEVAALKDRIKRLEQLVGKLTLENKQLKEKATKQL